MNIEGLQRNVKCLGLGGSPRGIKLFCLLALSETINEPPPYVGM
jgi:hypothetical protein